MPGPSEIRALIGLGGNLGEPARAMAQALNALDAADGVRVLAVSSLYRTPPWGVSGQPDFLNAAAALRVRISARPLLDLCLETERALRRERRERWGPRTIDMDILFYGDERHDEPGFVVPHPRMAARAFVLVPLAEIAPETDLDGMSVSARLAALPEAERQGIVRVAGRHWWRGPPAAPGRK